MSDEDATELDIYQPASRTPTAHKTIIAGDMDLEGYFVTDEWYVVMRRVCRSFGLDWSSQRQKIMEDPILREGVVLKTTPSAGGEQETFALRLDLFWGWCFKLSLSRLDPEVRSMLIPFQRAGYAALHAHFTGKTAQTDTLEARVASLESRMDAMQQRQPAPKAAPQFTGARRAQQQIAQAVAGITLVNIPNRPLSDAVREALRQAGRPLRPMELEALLVVAGVEVTHRTQVSGTLWHLYRDRFLARDGDGRYALPDDC